MYLFDTDTLSEVLKRAPSPRLLARLAEVPADQQFTSAITVGEMVYGAHRSPKREGLLRQLNARVWPNVRILPFDRSAAERYGAVRTQMEQTGVTIGEPDLRIASIALTHDLTVVTGNTRHFLRIPELRVENWM